MESIIVNLILVEIKNNLRSKTVWQSSLVVIILIAFLRNTNYIILLYNERAHRIKETYGFKGAIS